jgi:hypothetical protein
VPKADGLPDVQIRLENVATKPIANITVVSDMGEEWQLRSGQWSSRPLFVDAPEASWPLVVPPSIDIYIGTLAWGSSIQLSCHDNGWTGFPADKNPYVAQGSRSIFGYSFLFSPMIPIFFSGEEFDATFHALPGLSPDLYGAKNAGKGRWLYGAELDWNELNANQHRDMLIDVKKMIGIRKQYSSALAMCSAGKLPKLKAIQHESDIEAPIPYLRWDNHQVIVVAANRNRDRDAHLKLSIVLTGTGIEGHQHYRVTDLWSGAQPKTCTVSELASLSFIVGRDGVLGGGLSVFRIESVSAGS